MKLTLVGILLLFAFQLVSNYQLLSSAKKNLSRLSMKQKELSQGQSIESKNKKYFAKMQEDGNFVLYSSSAQNGRGKDNPTWASNTNGKGSGPFKCKMQEDGNLVVYDANNSPTWASNTNGKGKGPYRTIMQDDGNLVLYDQDNKPLWASNTQGRT